MSKNKKNESPNKSERQTAEMHIRSVQKEVKYDTRDYPIETLVKRFQDGDFFVPEYQREFIWTDKDQSLFIESVLMGLPIPMMFLAQSEDAKMEIVDGAQRIRSLEAFRNDDLTLEGLEQLKALNDFTYSQLPDSYKRWFDLHSLRIVVLDSSTTDSTKQILFNRINKFGKQTKPSERRIGSMQGKFMDFLKECADNALFLTLCPVTNSQKKRREPLELVTRFFAFSNNYKTFSHDVENFLDEYVKDNLERFDRGKMKSDFEAMLKFVEKYFPYGFSKSDRHRTTPRVRFEALAVGTNLALRENPKLKPRDVEVWLNSEEFRRHTTTHASNSGPRLVGRVEYVRDRLLGGAK